jgi:hypothetical protein
LLDSRLAAGTTASLAGISAGRSGRRLPCGSSARGPRSPRARLEYPRSSLASSPIEESDQRPVSRAGSSEAVDQARLLPCWMRARRNTPLKLLLRTICTSEARRFDGSCFRKHRESLRRRVCGRMNPACAVRVRSTPETSVPTHCVAASSSGKDQLPQAGFQLLGRPAAAPCIQPAINRGARI